MVRWTIKLAIATILLLPASIAGAATVDGVGQANSAFHVIAMFALVWCLSSLRIWRRNGNWRFGFELSPVRRVRALSTVHRANTRGRRVN